MGVGRLPTSREHCILHFRDTETERKSSRKKPAPTAFETMLWHRSSFSARAACEQQKHMGLE